MKRVAIVGIQGVPAQYGGFETLVENLIEKKSDPEIEYTVYCSARDYSVKMTRYKGARLRYIPLFHANGVESMPYDIISMIRSAKGYDTVMILGVSGCLFLPLFKRMCHGKVIVHIDGREHTRAKWGKRARQFLKKSEEIAVKYADTIIADTEIIRDYVTESYGRDSALIAYGGDHVLRGVPEDRQREILDRYGLESKKYGVSIFRVEPENNCHIILEAYAENGQEFVFIGNWERSAYGRKLREKYQRYGNIHLIDSIYDSDTLYTIRKNARLSVHGHSAGGTNPSLVEAMFFGHPILAYDVEYNRATTRGSAYYFKDATELKTLLDREDLHGEELRRIAERVYRWSDIVKRYEEIY